MTAKVPFMTKDSANDLCLKKDGTLCVVYVVKDAKSSSDAVLETFE
jgi:hypothetical protein